MVGNSTKLKNISKKTASEFEKMSVNRDFKLCFQLSGWGIKIHNSYLKLAKFANNGHKTNL
jgi:hypothetical protein